jgi:LmbE family N-acetylglucosaminyl deacetylase
MPKTVVVIAAHPDDEILGAGGTLRRHVLDGDEVHAFVVCEGETVRYQGREVGLAEHTRQAAAVVGFASIEQLGFPDQRLDITCLTDLTAALETRMRRVRPRIVYTHFGGDLNRDHRALVDAVLVACRPLDDKIEQVLGFETPSSTEWSAPNGFAPQHFVDITTALEDKLKAMACYTSELRDPPHPRSLDALRTRAAFWGSCAMMRAAEPFVVYRSYRRA